MKLTQLFETFDNFFPTDVEQREKYGDRLYDMLQKAYEPIGGLKGAGFNSPQDMIDNIPMWKVFRRGNDIKAAMFYKDKGGRKRVAVAPDGTMEGKRMLGKMLNDEYATNRAYAEISGNSLRFHKAILGEDILNDITIPAQQAVEHLKLSPDQYQIINKYEYARQLSDSMVPKRMIGTLGKHIT